MEPGHSHRVTSNNCSLSGTDRPETRLQSSFRRDELKYMKSVYHQHVRTTICDLRLARDMLIKECEQ